MAGQPHTGHRAQSAGEVAVRGHQLNQDDSGDDHQRHHRRAERDPQQVTRVRCPRARCPDLTRPRLIPPGLIPSATGPPSVSLVAPFRRVGGARCGPGQGWVGPDPAGEAVPSSGAESRSVSPFAVSPAAGHRPDSATDGLRNRPPKCRPVTREAGRRGMGVVHAAADRKPDRSDNRHTGSGSPAGHCPAAGGNSPAAGRTGGTAGRADAVPGR